MGIHSFFNYFKNTFGRNIKNLKSPKKFVDLDIDVDNLMIDLNGVYHASTQKIYKYGNHKPPARLLGHKNKHKRVGTLKKQIAVFKDVCDEIEKILDIVNPKKRIVLCVDGPAPLAKQSQQRQRRFRSAKEKNEDEFKEFDSNCITPGTKFMDYLSKYIDWHIRKRISESPKWQNIDVIFSSEKVAGEGEHKLIHFIRYYGDKDDSYCIHGLDADLIMLSLGTHVPKFWILREDLYNYNNDFYVIDIGETRNDLKKLMSWELYRDEETDEKPQYSKFNQKWSVNDFIFLCFMVGNDFLPHIPTIEIVEGGIQVMIEVYKKVCRYNGHITEEKDDKVLFRKDALEVFMSTIGLEEKKLLEHKLMSKIYFPDELINSHSKWVDTKYVLDIGNYMIDYYREKFDTDDERKISHDYLEGMQWVLSYYTRGVSNWKWCFKHHYAPFASNISYHIQSFEFPQYSKTNPSTPYQQLLCVLPPKSANLIPHPLNTLLTDPKSSLRKFCPDNFKIDLSGKRKEWQGIVLLPMVDFDLVREEYFKHIGDVDQRDIRRNRLGKSYVYFYTPNKSQVFNSYYGNIINCKVQTNIIDL